MPTNHDIKIISGNESTELLHIDPSYTVIADRNDTVTWCITNDPTNNVDEFKIKKKLFSRQIFSDSARPPSTPVKRGQGRISGTAKDGWVYKYSIKWKPKGSSDWLKHDPKIAINTSLHDDKSNLLLTAAVALTAIGLTALLFLSIQKRKKRHADIVTNAKAEADFSEPGILGSE